MLREFNWEFECFRDPVLEGMLKIAKEFAESLISGEYKFLTFSGPTEVGKTHLLQSLDELLRKIKFKTYWMRKTSDPVMYFQFNDICKYCLDDNTFMNTLGRCGVLIIEELLSFRVMNKWTDVQIDIAFELLNKRQGRATIIDTNKSEEELYGIDERIASRLFRNNGIFVSIPPNTIKYLNRPKHST